MSKEFTLTPEEFISRSIKGEVFLRKGDRYHYSAGNIPPFKVGDNLLINEWSLFDGKRLFTLEKPKPKIERRWLWLKDRNGYTETSYYVSNEYAQLHNFIGIWHKKVNDYIDVEINDKA